MSKVKNNYVGEKIYPLAGFKELLNGLFGSSKAYVEDNEIDDEVNKIIAEEDSAFISRQEKAVSTTESYAGGKKSKSDRINVKAAKMEEATKSINDIERDEER